MSLLFFISSKSNKQIHLLIRVQKYFFTTFAKKMFNQSCMSDLNVAI